MVVVMVVVVEVEEMETVAHDLTRIVVEGRPGTQARSRAGLDAFFSRPRRCTVGLASGRDFGFGPRRVLKLHFVPQEIDPLHQTVSPRATFISFRNVVAAPRYPDGRYAAGYRGAITRYARYCTLPTTKKSNSVACGALMCRRYKSSCRVTSLARTLHDQHVHAANRSPGTG